MIPNKTTNANLARELSESQDDNRGLTQKLHESEEMFRQFAETDQQVSFLVSMDRDTMYYVSPSYAKVWGRSCKSLYEDPGSWVNAVHPQDRERVRSALGKSKGGRLDLRYRIVRKDGTLRWILSRAEPSTDSPGGEKRLYVIALDVTDLKHARLDVVKSEMKYRRLFESAKDGILILDAGTGTIVEINPFVLHLLGYSAEDCYGKKLWEIGFFADVELSKKMFAELQSTGYVRYEDMPLKTKDGRAVQVEFVSNVYKVDGASVIQCNIRDITERKRTETGLRRLASIIESSHDCILGLSTEGNIESWNRASEALFGYSAAEITGKHVSILCPPHLLKDHLKLIEDVRYGKNIQQFETLRCPKEGKPIEVSVSIARILDVEGKLLGFSEVIRDITKSKELEASLRQSQKMEGIGRLAGGIAHDFNNLLTAIMGYSEFLMGSLSPTDHNREDVAEIYRAGERAASLTRQLLAFSRQQVLAFKILDINVIVADLDKMLRRIIGEEIELTFLKGEELGHVKADPGQIEQIIMNLCVNAKDAMPDGGKLLIETVRVELGEEYSRTHPDAKRGPYVMIAISDTGCGMTPAVMSHLFEPFFTTKEQGKGTGLGLSTVYGIVQQSGGIIDVYSEVGHGTVFKVYFPRIDDAVLPAKERPAVHTSHRGNEIILLVEDDGMVRNFAARVLNENGYSTLSAKTPGEAIRICEQHEETIDLMLTDVVMPEMLGYELAQRLASVKPEMKVIYMSGYTEQSIIQRAVAQGASFIQKPMTPESIVRQVREVLDAAA